MAYNVVDIYENNLNAFNTGIDESSVAKFKEKDTKSALAEMEQLRSNTVVAQDKSKMAQSSSIAQLTSSQSQINHNQQQKQQPQMQHQMQHQMQPQMQPPMQHQMQPQMQHQMQPQMQHQMQRGSDERAQPPMQLPMPQPHVSEQQMQLRQQQLQQQQLQLLQQQQQQHQMSQFQQMPRVEDIAQMYENQKMLANELKTLRSQLVSKGPTLGNENEYIQHIAQINTELERHKMINIALSNQLEELKSKSSNAEMDANKMQMLEKKKAEIISELAKVKEEHSRLENVITKNTEMETLINKKKRRYFGNY